MRTCALLLSLWLAGCDPSGVDDRDSGTAVGNPGDLDAAVVRVPPELTLDAVWVEVAGVALERCDGGGVPVPADVTLDALVPSFAPISLPGGRWCALLVELSAPVTIEGTTALGNGFSVQLALDTLWLDGPLDIDGDALLLGVPVPLEAAALDALGDGAVVLADDPTAQDWAAAAAPDVVIAVDADEDGVIGPGDPVVSSIVPPGPGLAADVQSAGDCGCRSAASGPWWWPARLLARRQARSRSELR